MTEKEFLELKNQIKEIYDLCHELNVYFSFQNKLLKFILHEYSILVKLI